MFDTTHLWIYLLLGFWHLRNFSSQLWFRASNWLLCNLYFFLVQSEDWAFLSSLLLGGSNITANGDCSHEIKRGLLLGRKVLTNLDSIFKAETQLCLERSVCSRLWLSPVAMYGCEGWTVKKAEQHKMDAIEIQCWRRLLREPWTAEGSNSLS